MALLTQHYLIDSSIFIKIQFVDCFFNGIQLYRIHSSLKWVCLKKEILLKYKIKEQNAILVNFAHAVS